MSTVDGPTCAGTGDVPASLSWSVRSARPFSVVVAVQRCCPTCLRGCAGSRARAGSKARVRVRASVSSRGWARLWAGVPLVRAELLPALRSTPACPCAGSGAQVCPPPRSFAASRSSAEPVSRPSHPASARPVVHSDCAAAGGTAAEGRPTGAACGGCGLRLSGPPRGAVPPRPSHRCVAEWSRPRRGRPRTPASSLRSADGRHALRRAPASPHASA